MCSYMNGNVSFCVAYSMLGICLAMVDGLVCACVCVPMAVNTVLFIWLVLACVVCLAGK